MVVVMKHLTSYADEAPFLIVALFKKINRELAVAPPEGIRLQFRETVPRFSMRRLKRRRSVSRRRALKVSSSEATARPRAPPGTSYGSTGYVRQFETRLKSTAIVVAVIAGRS